METEHLIVSGMSCGGCVTRVTEALTAIPGVGDVKVALATGSVEVTYDERQARPAQMTSAVERAGYGVAGSQVAVVSKSNGCCC